MPLTGLLRIGKLYHKNYCRAAPRHPPPDLLEIASWLEPLYLARSYTHLSAELSLYRSRVQVSDNRSCHYQLMGLQGVWGRAERSIFNYWFAIDRQHDVVPPKK